MRARVNTLRELDALVGMRVTGEQPEVYWEDAHAVFRFETEHEALEALKRMKAQPNLPKVNWEEMTVSRVQLFRPYSSEIAMAWSAVEKVVSPENGLRIRREGGMWFVAFGEREESAARSAAVAICAAALRTVGVDVVFDPDRIN